MLLFPAHLFTSLFKITMFAGDADAVFDLFDEDDSSAVNVAIPTIPTKRVRQNEHHNGRREDAARDHAGKKAKTANLRSINAEYRPVVADEVEQQVDQEYTVASENLGDTKVSTPQPGTSVTNGTAVSAAGTNGTKQEPKESHLVISHQVRHQVALPPDYPYVPISQHVPPENPARTYPFTLDPFQRTAIYSIQRNESVLVSAHTSAGKTVVAEYAIAQSLRDKQRVIYTSPIKVSCA